MTSIVQRPKGRTASKRARPDQLDEMDMRLRDVTRLDSVVFEGTAALDFRSMKLKPDHDRRPFWATPNGRIFLEASSRIYEAARDFLVAICEPVSRPDFVHEYRLDKNSLFAAASMGMTGDVIIASLKRMSKTPLSPQVEEFISQCTGGYGKVKLVLKRGRFYIESSYPAVLRLLAKHPLIRRAQVRVMANGVRVIGVEGEGEGGEESGFMKGEALAEDETSLGLKRVLDEERGGRGGAAAGGVGVGSLSTQQNAPYIAREVSGEVNSDEEAESRALEEAYAAVARKGPPAAGAGAGAPVAPPKPANILDQLDDLTGEELGDLLSTIDTVLGQYEQAQARAAVLPSTQGAEQEGLKEGTGKGSQRGVSFKDDAAVMGYDAAAAASTAARGVARSSRGPAGLMGGAVTGRSLLDAHAKIASVAVGEAVDTSKQAPPELAGEALAAWLRARATASMPGGAHAGSGMQALPPSMGADGKPKLRFKMGQAKGHAAVASGEGGGGGGEEDPGRMEEEGEGEPSAPAGEEEGVPTTSEMSKDFVTRSGLVYADGSKPIGGATSVAVQPGAISGTTSTGTGVGGGAQDDDYADGDEEYKPEEDQDYKPDEDAYAADAEALAEEMSNADEDDADVVDDDDDDGFVRRRGRGRGRGGAGVSRGAGAGRGRGGRGAGHAGTVPRGNRSRPEGAAARGERSEVDLAAEEQREAKRLRKEAEVKTGDDLEQFRSEASKLGESLHLSTPGSVEAFEIDPKQIESVRHVCLHLDPPFPLMQEYDHSNDTGAVPPLLDADKKPVLLRDPSLLRDYQRKSLAKMFGNGRARSGIIVLPCGAGKTLVGISACVTVGKSCVVLCPNAMSVMQWEDQFVRFSTLPRESIVKLTSKHKSAMPPRHQGCVLITTYTMMAVSKRSKESEVLMKDISEREWGIQLLDEVHLAVAEKYSQALKLRCHTRLGLTATLVREDAREINLAHMIGPKLYEANWMDLTRAGYLANVQCTEVWCPMAPEFYREYCRAKGEHTRMALACCNPVKCWAMDFLLKFHEGRGDKVIIFSESIFAIQLYASQYQGIVIAGSTPQREREAYIHAFRNTDTVNKLFLSRVGDMALDVPDANVIIQISAHYGSRLQEAQRMGRILRRGTRGNAASGNNAYFYSLVSLDTREMADATRRRRYLVDQGYAYRVLECVPGLVKSQEELMQQASFQKTYTQRLAVLESVLRENMEELEARETGQLDDFDVAPEVSDEGQEEGRAGGGQEEEGGLKGPGDTRKLDNKAAAQGRYVSSALLPPSKLTGGAGALLSSGLPSTSKLAALSGAEGRRYTEYQADESGRARLASAEQARRLEAQQAARSVPKPQQGR